VVEQSFHKGEVASPNLAVGTQSRLSSLPFPIGFINIRALC